MNRNATEFILKEFPNEIYSISSDLWMQQKEPGGAIMQTWIVKGNTQLLVIDSPIPEKEGFRAYIENIFNLPVVMVNSHGHIDHIGCNSQFQVVWQSKEDWTLTHGGGISRSNEKCLSNKLEYQLLDLKDGHEFDLGNRKIKTYSLPGHTKGSIVLYDEKSKSLFSGDAVARRILYGMSDWTPLKEYFEALNRIKKLDIETIYSMHDSFSLPGDMPERIIENIIMNLHNNFDIWVSPVDGREFRRIHLGKDELDINYFDFVIPIDKLKEEQEHV